MMTKNDEINIYLVRHGEAGKSWDEDLDPGLSDKGKEQSKKLVSELDGDFRLLNFKAISSPLARAQETAIPLQEKHGFDIEIYKTFAEIPSPGIEMSQRSTWLKEMFKVKIDDLEDPQQKWRNSIVQSIQGMEEDTIIFSHFMVINCVVGWINNFDSLVGFYPDNCSVTKIINRNGKLELTRVGNELSTVVQ
jgi:broad specificity phosphatase PhoE